MISWKELQKGIKSLNRGDLHVWKIMAFDNIDILDEMCAVLAADEIVKANKYRFEKDRAVYITAKYLLRNLIGGYLGLVPERIKFEYSKYGKPYFSNKEVLDFNVSHSGNQILIGFAKKNIIGVDIEKIKENFDPLELAKNFFSKEEIAILESEPDVYSSFYRCWTRKESFIKAVGEGLSYPLDSFAVTMDADHRAKFLKIENTEESQVNWQLYSFVPKKGYIAAITTSGITDNTTIFDANEIFF